MYDDVEFVFESDIDEFAVYMVLLMENVLTMRFGMLFDVVLRVMLTFAVI